MSYTSDKNGEIPWGVDEMKPHGLITSKDMTPEQLERAREDALIWAQIWARCENCGGYLSEEPRRNCTNHGVKQSELEPELVEAK